MMRADGANASLLISGIRSADPRGDDAETRTAPDRSARIRGARVDGIAKAREVPDTPGRV